MWQHGEAGAPGGAPAAPASGNQCGRYSLSAASQQDWKLILQAPRGSLSQLLVAQGAKQARQARPKTWESAVAHAGREKGKCTAELPEKTELVPQSAVS